jgi:acetoin utilization deacetylase AcuC-like enzyme
VFTCSFHGRNNYPFHKEASDLDVELEDGTDTAAYLRLLQTHLPRLLHVVQPDFVFYLSGVDILETDKFGKLKVTLEGCGERDAIVFNALRRSGVPCVVSMGGGYSPEVRTIVEAHCNTFRLAKELYGLD